MQLDDPAFVLKNDSAGMMNLTLGFPNQCREALTLFSNTNLLPDLSGRQQVVVSGMGGSAAAGDFLKVLLDCEGSVPSTVIRDYKIPKFVGPNTLFFACSYSGNTEETISATKLAHEKGSSIICISTGGELSEYCQSHHFPVITIPGGQPPRTALGYLLIPLIASCIQLGYLPEQKIEAAINELEKCRDDWKIESNSGKNQTKALATMLFGRIPIIYGLGTWQSTVASRWKSQINENAKIMCFANAFPELNHNEIVGWTLADLQNAKHWATVILENGLESPKMKLRAQVTADLIKGKSELFHVTARGDSFLAQILSLAYFGDFVSLYLAALYGADPVEIKNINLLKEKLSEMT